MDRMPEQQNLQTTQASKPGPISWDCGGRWPSQFYRLHPHLCFGAWLAGFRGLALVGTSATVIPNHCTGASESLLVAQTTENRPLHWQCFGAVANALPSPRCSQFR